MNPNKVGNRGDQRRSAAGLTLMNPNPLFGLLPKEFIKRVKDVFTYNVVFNTIGATTTTTQSANIQNDADFVWTHASMIVTNAAGTTFTAPQDVACLIEIKDAAAGRDLQDSQTHLSALFGTAQNPFILPFPKIFRAGGQIAVKLQNQTAGALVVRLAFHGFKAFFMDAAE